MATFPSKVNFVTGDVLTATNMNDIGGAINLLDGAQYSAGKNKIINGDCFQNQRSTTSTTTSGTYLVDRFRILLAATAGSVTGSVQQFTPGTAPVAGYEAKQYCRVVTVGQAASTDRALFGYGGIEDVRSFAGQTVTLSFWAKAATGTPSVAVEFTQLFGSGGSPSATVTAIGATKTAITTSWARYTFTVAIPSIAGKTIGTDANTSTLQFGIWLSAGSTFDARTASLGLQNNTFDLWGMQVEDADTASPFQTATGSIQGELAACQRYYWRSTNNVASTMFSLGAAYSTTAAQYFIKFPISMRIYPSSLDYSNLNIQDIGTGTLTAPTAVAINTGTPEGVQILATGGSGFTQYRPYGLTSPNSTAVAYIGLNAEF